MKFLLIFIISFAFINSEIYSKSNNKILNDTLSNRNFTDTTKQDSLIDSNSNPPKLIPLLSTYTPDRDTILGLPKSTLNFDENNRLAGYPDWEYENNYWIPLVGILGVNGIFAGWNRFVTQKPYGYIDFWSIRDNFRHGWVWDDNDWGVNQIGHPYQGSLYYSMARYYGHGYLEGLAYTMFGSWQWEMFMEKEWAAINDLVTTTLGGPMVGEMLYRLSEKVLDDRSRGAERFFRELGAGLINPVLGLNRLIHAESWSKTATRRRTKTNNRISGIAFVGWRLGFSESKKDETGVASGKLRLNLAYGSPYLVKKPFDYFLLELGFGLGKSEKEEKGENDNEDEEKEKTDVVINVKAHATLWNTRLSFFKNRTLFGITHNYDYIGSNLYKVGATSFGANLSAKYPLGQSGWGFLYNVELNAIAMGGASTEYYFHEDRDYNLGPGAGFKTILIVGKRDFAIFGFKIDGYWIHTISGAEGDEFIGVGIAEVEKTIWKGLGVAVAYEFYNRTGIYQKYDRSLDDVSINSHEFKGFLTYKF